MNKEFIVSEIRRLAKENEGRPPGSIAFRRETGIIESQWQPYLWLRWSDALKDAGFEPNEFRMRLDDDVYLEKYVELVHELGRIPLMGEYKRKARIDASYPSYASLVKRFGDKHGYLSAAKDFCEKKGDLDALTFIDQALAQAVPKSAPWEPPKTIRTGFVYLMKSGKHYKIGRSKSVGGREQQIGLIIPIPPKTLHSIETDDPAGVEAYWHRRFADKRGEGEWFDLSRDDIEAFKRWKKIV